MKEISIFIHTNDLKKVTEILQKYNVIGMSFYHIEGAGEAKREAMPEMVRSYVTGRTIIPEQHLAMHVPRTCA
jgi:nitrogen regulatory protein PII